MENRRALVVTGLVVLGIIVLLFGTVWFLFNFIRGRQQTNNDIFPQNTTTLGEATASGTPLGYVSPTPTPTSLAGGTTTLPGTGLSDKTFTGKGFQLTYPGNWGLLTCNNSLDAQSFEFDPANSTNKLDVYCENATKPITILVGNNDGCGGQTVTLGNIQVQKSVEKSSTDTDYRWCTKTTPVLNITHRVSTQTKTAHSTKDYSSDLEEIIASFGSR